MFQTWQGTRHGVGRAVAARVVHDVVVGAGLAKEGIAHDAPPSRGDADRAMHAFKS